MRIDFNIDAFREIRCSPGVEADIRSRTTAVADACGRGYEATVIIGKSRARGSVITATPRAMRDNSTNNTLVRSLGAGG
jgi:hypothetical protein